MSIKILTGDCREVLLTLSDESVQCVVTSPPYFGLRDYGTASWEGGDVECAHLAPDDGGTTDKPTAGQRTHAGRFAAASCHRCGAIRVDKQIGLEQSPQEYVDNIVAVFREVRRVLRKDGTLWLNLGDSYHSVDKWGGGGVTGKQTIAEDGSVPSWAVRARKQPVDGLKPKDLIGIPWRVAFALQADGWWLRQDIIWCLSGGAWVYARTQKGDMPMMVRDLARLKPGTAQLWNGEKWTSLLGMSKSARRGDEIEIVLRSGERISCTPTHRFPTNRGVIDAIGLKHGDIIATCRLPEPERPRDCALDEDAAWLAGLYLAEGSRSDDCIQIAGHAKEDARWDRVQIIAEKFGGSATQTIKGNGRNIRMHGRVLNAIIDELVTGRIAKDKGFSPVVWRYSNAFIASMLAGYLSGDGHWEPHNKRWRLGFTRNYNLERDLRVACARLGYHLSLRPSTSQYQGGVLPSFRGELRMERSGHCNQKNMGEVVKIRKARCREVYDLGVADEPHLFAMASGVLTHNSKPNPMPESVTDRCTKGHEYLFLLSKSPRYYFDAEAIAEPIAASSVDRLAQDIDNQDGSDRVPGKTNGKMKAVANSSWKGSRFDHGKTAEHQLGRAQVRPKGNAKTFRGGGSYTQGRSFDNSADIERDSHGNEPNETGLRNRRSVWTVATQPFKEAHFATFPPSLIEPCIKAGTSEKGCCAKCGAPWERVVERTAMIIDRSERTHEKGDTRASGTMLEPPTCKTLGWRPTCKHDVVITPCVILDPFGGAGTSGLVADRLGRNAILIELNPQYAAMAERRINGDAGMFSNVQIVKENPRREDAAT